MNVKRFRNHLKALVEEVVSSHKPLRVTRRGGEAFVVMSEQDWERERESLYVLQNTDLMQQIAKSMITYS